MPRYWTREQLLLRPLDSATGLTKRRGKYYTATVQLYGIHCTKFVLQFDPEVIKRYCYFIRKLLSNFRRMFCQCIPLFTQRQFFYILRFVLSDKLHPQTIACVQTRAIPFGITVEVMDLNKLNITSDIGGIIFQYPDTEGSIHNFTDLVAKAK